jgi:hypothetical protein
MTDSDQPIRVALVTGGHPFDVPALHAVFRSMPGVNFWPQDLQDFTTDVGKVAHTYDVVVLYCFYMFKPDDQLPWYFRKVFEGLGELGRPGQGVLVLHHGMLAMPDWPVYDQLTGMTRRVAAPVNFGQQMNIQVVDADHPATRGLPPRWTITDETYKLPDAELMPDSQPLLATDHPDSFATMAWARRHGQSRVITYLAGHDRVATENEQFRQFMAHAIDWLAERS